MLLGIVALALWYVGGLRVAIEDLVLESFFSEACLDRSFISSRAELRPD